MIKILATLALLTAATASSAQPIKIGEYGDSTIEGATLETGSVTISPYNEPASLQASLQARFGAVVTVENHGIGGITCPALLWGRFPVKQSWAKEMAQSTAQIITVNPAINDAFEPNEAQADFIWCYEQLIAIAWQHGKTVVIETPNPINDPHNVNLWYLVNDEQWIAAQYNVPIVDQWTAIMTSLPNWQADLPQNVHPNDALYRYKSSLSYIVLAPIVGQYLAAN